MSTDSTTLPCLVRMPHPFEVQQQYYEEKDCQEINTLRVWDLLGKKYDL